MAEPNPVFWVSIAMLGFVVLVTLPLAILILRNTRSNRLRILASGAELAELRDEPAGFARSFGMQCASYGSVYQKYFGNSSYVSEEEFRDWLHQGLEDGAAPWPKGTKFWGLKAKSVKDTRMVHRLAVKIKELAEPDLKKVNYLVGLSPMGELLAAYLAAHSDHGVVLPLQMMPPAFRSEKGNETIHIMLVDTGMNTGFQLSRAKQWVKEWFPDAETTVVIGVENDLIDKKLGYASDASETTEVRKLEKLSSILNWKGN